jgi:hypothetical protein
LAIDTMTAAHERTNNKSDICKLHCNTWEEDGEIWRRLKVTFPDNIARHTREQVSYFGSDGLLRRHDYAVDVLGGAKGAHYIGDYREHGGIPMPHHRRVYPPGADNRKIREPVLIAIDIVRLSFGSASALARRESLMRRGPCGSLEA